MGAEEVKLDTQNIVAADGKIVHIRLVPLKLKKTAI